VAPLPDDDPLSDALATLREAADRLSFATPAPRASAVSMVLRVMLHHGVDELSA
jgi:hypothetical protein